MIHPIWHVHRRLRRLRRAMWMRRHYRVCGNCRHYWATGGYLGHEFCTFRAWHGDTVVVDSEQPGCEMWRRLPDGPEAD